jgi:hypothetical protein
MARYSFTRLMAVYVLWLASMSLAASLFEVYFFNLGLPVPNIYLADTLLFFGSLLIIPLIRSFRARDMMMAGIATALVASAILFLDPQPSAAYLFRLIVGFTNLLFWGPFNILFYEYRKGNNAALGALYYAATPALSLFTPAIAGYLATVAGFPVLYALSTVSFAATLVAAYFLVENKEFSYTVSSCIRALSGLRTLIFMEGFAAAIITSITLTVMLLLFAAKPITFGLFTSLVTVFAIVASVIAAQLSDKLKSRRAFILPVVGLFSVSVILASRSWDFLSFFIGFGLVNFFSRIFFPLPFALVVDNSKSLVESMVGRELYLNLGRLCGGLLGYLLLISTDIQTVLLLQGVMLLAYIPVFENRKRKLSSS